MNKHKIFNDPVYGFVKIRHEILFDLIQHPCFQRLRRISQMGLAHLTYPGAVHSRFQHALGALHLMGLAISVLREKGARITPAESEAVSIAILLHDIGHGPFSHALEGKLVDADHEELSWNLMLRLNGEFDGRLAMAMEIFANRYPKKFLNQLVSSQLDLDRLDYLNRDSFYTGVMEGKIGYDRIIQMLRVVDDRLVVEEKGLASIEKFLVARKIMYWQVYLHKTVVAAEKMLIALMERLMLLEQSGEKVHMGDSIKALVNLKWKNPSDRPSILDAFVQLDDTDIMILMKNSLPCADYIAKTLARGLLYRNLFRVELSSDPTNTRVVDNLCKKIAEHLNIGKKDAHGLVWSGSETVEVYNKGEEEISFYLKSGQVKKLSQIFNVTALTEEITRYYLCYPKDIKR